MQVSVVFFAFARDRMNARTRTYDLAPGSTVADLYRQHLAEPLRAPLEQWMFSVNREWARPDRVLAEGDEVAVIPPVSGG
ncbi:MAG: MoaD/ThiS family protein [Firmicutes bacterium]|nr:MoaD/ThiS family protein [Alicyclobacillaceae bacterium]MCL6498026.1 MoaD/ThiS family protein [Bacillota bacterium]